MITINGYQIKPTIFPDGTSQIWKLPEELFRAELTQFVWNFEHEREIIDLCSAVLLLQTPFPKTLHMPYLPYARQDKGISNESTFNLEVLAGIINQLDFDKVTAVDAHNPKACRTMFYNFENIPVTNIHQQVLSVFQPDTIAFPDLGALDRYGGSFHGDTMIFDKKRDQATGNIVGHKISGGSYDQPFRVLIVDDLCDGGATFISVAKAIHEEINPSTEVGLYITHGIFSRGREHLLNNGISKIFTTNSLLKNSDGYKV